MSARVLLIDNHDSFTFNLVQALRGLGAGVRVARNDEIVPRGEWETTPVAAGDRIEIVGAVQGG